MYYRVELRCKIYVPLCFVNTIHYTLYPSLTVVLDINRLILVLVMKFLVVRTKGTFQLQVSIQTLTHLCWVLAHVHLP